MVRKNHCRRRGLVGGGGARAWGFTPFGWAATAAATWSNKLMRIRVLAQFIAILIIIAVALFQRHISTFERGR